MQAKLSVQMAMLLKNWGLSSCEAQYTRTFHNNYELFNQINCRMKNQM